MDGPLCIRSQDRTKVTPSVDIKTASSLHRLRLVSAPESHSDLHLLYSSEQKRTTDINAVPVKRANTGLLIILYVLLSLDACNRTRRSFGTAAVYFLCSVVPLGGFYAERRLKREAEDAVIASRARTESAVEA